MRDIVSPRLFSKLANFFPSTVTIQAASEVRAASGQPTKTWAAVTGMTAISALLAPATGGENKTQSGIWTKVTHTIALAGYYPLITTKMRVRDDATGQVYDILLPMHDGLGTSTRLLCEVVT